MDARSTRWKAVKQTQFPWEREALDFVRERLPDHDPYLAWANFEFVAEDGSGNELDLLVLTPKGFFLVEIKSRPGTILGDLQNWDWKNADGVWTTDNPLLLANRKAICVPPAAYLQWGQVEASPEVAEARRFEERMTRAIREGA